MEQENIIITPVPQNDGNFETKKYTQISNASCDCKTVRILKRLLSGRYGSLTGINSYLFQNIISSQINNNLAKTLNELSLEELLHASLIGNAIQSFGGMPRFSNGQGTFWSARNVNYETNQNQFIRNNILREECAIKELEQAILQVSNQSLISLLKEIILDKQSHITKLKVFLN